MLYDMCYIYIYIYCVSLFPGQAEAPREVPGPQGEQEGRPADVGRQEDDSNSNSSNSMNGYDSSSSKLVIVMIQEKIIVVDISPME